jgi:hypothetical protein
MISTKRRTITLQAILSATKVHGAGDKADLFMPKFDQIFGGVIRPLPVGGANSRAWVASTLMINKNKGEFVASERTSIIREAAGQNKQ